MGMTFSGLENQPQTAIKQKIAPLCFLITDVISDHGPAFSRTGQNGYAPPMFSALEIISCQKNKK
jgi:hypothetical protein